MSTTLHVTHLSTRNKNNNNLRRKSKAQQQTTTKAQQTTTSTRKIPSKKSHKEICMHTYYTTTTPLPLSLPLNRNPYPVPTTTTTTTNLVLLQSHRLSEADGQNACLALAKSEQKGPALTPLQLALRFKPPHKPVDHDGGQSRPVLPEP